MTPPEIFGWFGVGCVVLSCALLTWSRHALEQATTKWREAADMWEKIDALLTEDEAHTLTGDTNANRAK